MKTFHPTWMPTKQEQARQYNQYVRDKERDKFYHSKAWRKLRALKLMENPVCETCQHALAEIVHHKLEIKEAPDLALDLDNLESQCRGCHNRRHKSKDNQDTTDHPPGGGS